MTCDSLLVVTEIRQALAEAKSLEDVLAIRNKADAIRRLLKLKNESLAAQNDMAEITVNAEIMLGEAAKKIAKRGGDRKSKLPRETLILSDLGIAKIESHRWQTMAAAKKQVAKLLRAANEDGKEFTRAMVYREGKRILKGDTEPKVRDANEIVGILRRHIFKLFDDHAELQSELPRVLREIADELNGFTEEANGSGRRRRKEAASAA